MNVATILKAKGRAVSTARPDTTLQDVCAKLASKKIGAVVIVGEDLRTVLGVGAKVLTVTPNTFDRTDFKARRVVDDRKLFQSFGASS